MTGLDPQREELVRRHAPRPQVPIDEVDGEVAVLGQDLARRAVGHGQLLGVRVRDDQSNELSIAVGDRP